MRSNLRRRRLGQHFLRDPAAIERIVAAIAPQPGQRMVEIGPGDGALSLPLLARLGELTVVERDPVLAHRLQRRLPPGARLRLLRMDVLQLDWQQLVADGMPLRLVGNLPYAISTPLLFHCLEARAGISDMTFLLQREVGERLAAKAGEPAYGRLSVMVQAWCRVECLFDLEPGCFQPPPKVYSTLVQLHPRRTPLVTEAHVGAYTVIVRQAFSQRRKTLRNALAGLLDAAAIEAVGLSPALRPDACTPEQYALLATRLPPVA